MKCNGCGAANLIKGLVSGSASAGKSVYSFEPTGGSFFDKLFSFDEQYIDSYACVACGNLQFIVKFDDETKKKYLELNDEPRRSVKE